MSSKGVDILNKTLITGAYGMVGSYIDFGYKMDHRMLDVTDLNDALSVVKKYKPETIIHLAAETDVPRCERDPQHAYFVNSIGTYNMAVAAKEVGAKFVYVSTSAIFDGTKKNPYTESDEPNPQDYYGRSKYLGEAIVKDILNDYIIARIAWVFGGGKKKDEKFVAKIIQQIHNTEIKVVKGMRGSPTYGKDLVQALKKLIISNKKGIFHLSNTGSPSRLDIVKEIVRITNSKAKVVEVEPSFFGLTKITENQGMISKVNLMRSWEDALKEYIKEEWADHIN